MPIIGDLLSHQMNSLLTGDGKRKELSLVQIEIGKGWWELMESGTRAKFTESEK